MKKTLLALFVLLAVGCSSAPETETVTVGMSYDEMAAIMGEDFIELPNLSGDNRRILIYESDDSRTMVAMVGDEVAGYKEIPRG